MSETNLKPNPMKNDLKEKMYGCLYGQAVGDALGLGAEGLPKRKVEEYYPEGLRSYNEIVQDEFRRRWPKGAWTDDTDMMLCILKAFDNGTIDTNKAAVNFKEWFNGTPMGIGSHTYKVLAMVDYPDNAEEYSKLWWELSRQQTAANGALMRTSVIGLLRENYVATAEKVCRLTHYDGRCVGSCVIMCEIIHNLVWNDRRLTFDEIVAIADKYDSRIKEWISLAYESTEVGQLELDEPYSMGYTLRTLAAGLWCFFHAKDFESGLLAVVNEGGDADTNGAVSGAIMGAMFGLQAIPDDYIKNLRNLGLYQQNLLRFINQVAG